MTGTDGGVFAYGDATFWGSTAGQHINAPIDSIVRTDMGSGYWLSGQDGGVYSFGSAQFYGSEGGKVGPPPPPPLSAGPIPLGVNAAIDHQDNSDTAAVTACDVRSGFKTNIVDLATYVSQTDNPSTEIANSLASGQYVATFQGYYAPDFAIPGEAAPRASQAVTAAEAANYPKKATIFLDLEQDTSGTSESEMFTWVQTWAQTVSTDGYTPGVYIGEPQELTATDFNSLAPTVTAFWPAPGTPQTLSLNSGAEILQTSETMSNPCGGVALDTDTVQANAIGQVTVGEVP
jgi:hypothetical protein